MYIMRYISLWRYYQYIKNNLNCELLLELFVLSNLYTYLLSNSLIFDLKFLSLYTTCDIGNIYQYYAMKKEQTCIWRTSEWSSFNNAGTVPLEEFMFAPLTELPDELPAWPAVDEAGPRDLRIFFYCFIWKIRKMLSVFNYVLFQHFF